MTLHDQVIAALDAAGIPWAVIGAAALAAHGISRSTLDLDLLVTDARVLDRSLWTMAEGSTAVDIRRGDADDPLAGVVRFEAANERPVDLVVGRSAWQRDVIARADTIEGTSPALRIVRPADLVLLKLYAGGSQDRWDIEQLLAGDESHQLAGEVEGRLGDLPARCRQLWERITAGL